MDQAAFLCPNLKFLFCHMQKKYIQEVVGNI